jgi:hypothetical protein
MFLPSALRCFLKSKSQVNIRGGEGIVQNIETKETCVAVLCLYLKTAGTPEYEDWGGEVVVQNNDEQETGVSCFLKHPLDRGLVSPLLFLSSISLLLLSKFQRSSKERTMCFCLLRCGVF